MMANYNSSYSKKTHFIGKTENTSYYRDKQNAELAFLNVEIGASKVYKVTQ
jgi:hypothetical protein